MRGAVKALMLAAGLAGFLGAPSGPARAADDAGDDLRCLIASLQMAASDVPQAKAAGLSASFYWMGRVDARVADSELEERMMVEIAGLKAEELRSEGLRCAQALIQRGHVMQNIGDDIQRRAKELLQQQESR
jgi:hypothetical protein